MPTYKIERCTADDAAGLARNNMSAYWTDPTWILIWEKDRTLESVIEACEKRVPNNLQADRAHKRHLKAVEIETGTIVGYIRFVLPERLNGQWLDAQTPEATPEEQAEFQKRSASADWTFRPGVGSMDAPVHPFMEKYMGTKKYMELEYLAVQPAYKGRGIASMLVERGIAEAEKMGIDIFVMAYKAGLGVYKRLGFELLDSIIIDDSPWGGKGEYGCYFMERKVNKQ